MKVTTESLKEELHGWDVEEVDDEVYSAMETATGDTWRIPGGTEMTEEGKKFDAGKRSPIEEFSRTLCVFTLPSAGLLLVGDEITQREARMVLNDPRNDLSLSVDVIGFGELKYGPGNWRHVENGRRRYSDAFWRHALSLIYYPDSPIIDAESGFTHEAHALCNLIFLSWDGLK